MIPGIAPPPPYGPDGAADAPRSDATSAAGPWSFAGLLVAGAGAAFAIRPRASTHPPVGGPNMVRRLAALSLPMLLLACSAEHDASSGDPDQADDGASEVG